MANISKITASDGVTYNLVDNTSGYVKTDEKVTQTEVTSDANLLQIMVHTRHLQLV